MQFRSSTDMHINTLNLRLTSTLTPTPKPTTAPSQTHLCLPCCLTLLVTQTARLEKCDDTHTHTHNRTQPNTHLCRVLPHAAGHADGGATETWRVVLAAGWAAGAGTCNRHHIRYRMVVSLTVHTVVAVWRPCQQSDCLHKCHWHLQQKSHTLQDGVERGCLCRWLQCENRVSSLAACTNVIGTCNKSHIRYREVLSKTVCVGSRSVRTASAVWLLAQMVTV